MATKSCVDNANDQKIDRNLKYFKSSNMLASSPKKDDESNTEKKKKRDSIVYMRKFLRRSVENTSHSKGSDNFKLKLNRRNSCDNLDDDSDNTSNCDLKKKSVFTNNINERNQESKPCIDKINKLVSSPNKVTQSSKKKANISKKNVTNKSVDQNNVDKMVRGVFKIKTKSELKHTDDNNAKQINDTVNSEKNSNSNRKISLAIKSTKDKYTSKKQIKVVIRFIPPDFTEKNIIQLLDEKFAGKYIQINYVPAERCKDDSAGMCFAHSYIYFSTEEDAKEFIKNHNGFTVTNSKFDKYKLGVAFAPYQNCYIKEIKEGKEVNDKIVGDSKLHDGNEDEIKKKITDAPLPESVDANIPENNFNEKKIEDTLDFSIDQVELKQDSTNNVNNEIKENVNKSSKNQLEDDPFYVSFLSEYESQNDGFLPYSKPSDANASSDQNLLIYDDDGHLITPLVLAIRENYGVPTIRNKQVFTSKMFKKHFALIDSDSDKKSADSKEYKDGTKTAVVKRSNKIKYPEGTKSAKNQERKEIALNNNSMPKNSSEKRHYWTKSIMKDAIKSVIDSNQNTDVDKNRCTKEVFVDPKGDEKTVSSNVMKSKECQGKGFWKPIIIKSLGRGCDST